MFRQIGLLITALLFTPCLALCQHNCPDGFNYAGTLSGTGSYGGFSERRELALPEDVALDTSYQQPAVRLSSGTSALGPSLMAAEIPRGIYISPHGSVSREKGWTVSDPRLERMNSRYKFGMNLSCTSAASLFSDLSACEVDVEVCYKSANIGSGAEPLSVAVATKNLK